jgi:CheY-like chemotaxis protein
MPKVLLVEDDNNLREIFEMRLQAEGYKTVSAGDGEEALVIAVKEKPDLVIADVMMPKLSGFEMVENMRAAPELANVKVIMMTALGQAEDKIRGEKLGVVKYLVKSQVTLEDFVRIVREVLPPDGSASLTNATPQDTTTIEPQNNNQESEASMQDDNSTANPSAPVDPGANPAPADQPASANPISDAPASGVGGSEPQSTAQEQSAVNDQITDFTNSDAPAAPASDAPGADSSAPASAPDIPVSSPPLDQPAADPNSSAPAADPAAAPAAPSDPAAPAQDQNQGDNSQNANTL